MNTHILSSQEHKHEQIDLSPLNKTNLLQDARSMKNQLNSNKITEIVMSIFLDKLIAVTTKVIIHENFVAQLQVANKQMNTELTNCTKRNKKLFSNYNELWDEMYYVQKDISRIDQYSRR